MKEKKARRAAEYGWNGEVRIARELYIGRCLVPHHDNVQNDNLCRRLCCWSQMNTMATKRESEEKSRKLPRELNETSNDIHYASTQGVAPVSFCFLTNFFRFHETRRVTCPNKCFQRWNNNLLKMPDNRLCDLPFGADASTKLLPPNQNILQCHLIWLEAVLIFLYSVQSAWQHCISKSHNS